MKYVLVALVVLLSTSCTKMVPVKIVETKTKVVRVEVPTPVLQRCLAPRLPEPPDIGPYKCKKGHLCYDPENRVMLEEYVGMMFAHIMWLETYCTQQTKEEVISPALKSELEELEKGPLS